MVTVAVNIVTTEETVGTIPTGDDIVPAQDQAGGGIAKVALVVFRGIAISQDVVGGVGGQGHRLVQGDTQLRGFGDIAGFVNEKVGRRPLIPGPVGGCGGGGGGGGGSGRLCDGSSAGGERVQGTGDSGEGGEMHLGGDRDEQE